MKSFSFASLIFKRFRNRHTLVLFVFSLISLFMKTPCFGSDLLTPEERRWIEENKSRLVLAVETNYQPFVFKDSNDHITGLAHEYMQLLEKKLGVQFRQSRFSSLDSIFDSVKRNEVQIVNAVTETPWRSTFLSFTAPYIKVPNVIVTRKERTGTLTEKDLSGLRLSLVKNYAVTEYLLKTCPGLKPDLAQDDLTALFSVSFGRSDAAVIDLASASYLISRENITNLRVAGKATMDIRLAIGTSRNVPHLHTIIEKGVHAITESEREAILRRWVNTNSGILLTDKRFWSILAGVLSIVFALISGILIWNRALRQQVALRTRDLEKKTEALQKSEESLKRAAEAGKVGLWDWDLNTNKVFFSPNWKHQIGYMDHEIEGRYEEWESRIHPDDLEKTLSTLKRTGSPPWPLYDVEFRFRHKNGSYRWILATGEIEFDAHKNPIRMMGSHVDITEIKRAEEEKASLESQLQQAQKMESVGRLAGGVAHDFNNMLSVIIGHAEIAKDHLEPVHPVHENLDEITKAAERSAALTRQLLAFARKQTVSPKVIDLNEAVTDMLKMLLRLIGEHIHLTWVPGPDLWPVKIDPSQIDQVLTNLCVNARDAIAGTGKITIHTHNTVVDEAFCSHHPDALPGEFAALSVIDSGCGMDEETMAHVFEPFYTTKGLGEGTGLGLSSVYGAVRQNNGFVTVRSEPQKATEFTIFLPRVKPNPQGHS